MAITMTGMLVPSATLTYIASRWGHNNRDLRAVRAFKQGMAPVVVGLILAGCIVRVDEHTAVVRWPSIRVNRARFCLHVAVRISPVIAESVTIPNVWCHTMGSGQDPLRIDQHGGAAVHPHNPGVFVIGFICAADHRQWSPTACRGGR